MKTIYSDSRNGKQCGQLALVHGGLIPLLDAQLKEMKSVIRDIDDYLAHGSISSLSK